MSAGRRSIRGQTAPPFDIDEWLARASLAVNRALDSADTASACRPGSIEGAAIALGMVLMLEGVEWPAAITKPAFCFDWSTSEKPHPDPFAFFPSDRTGTVNLFGWHN